MVGPVDHTEDPDIIDCSFCRRISIGHFLFEADSVLVFRDAFPVTDGHCHIVPRRHEENFFDLPRMERDALWDSVPQVLALLRKEYGATGFNLGVNIGEAAGQSVSHTNIHVIPRYDEDRGGGMRWALRGKKADYKRRAKKCGFCAQIKEGRITREKKLAVSFPDDYPITPGHRHVTSREHIEHFTDLPEDVRDQMWDLVEEEWAEIKEDGDIDGLNLGINIGYSAGKSVPHANIHLIPRRIGDVDEREGGMRWVRGGQEADWESGLV